MKTLASTCATALVLVIGVGQARATDWFTLIDWACDPKNKNGTAATIKADVLSACGLSENGQGLPSICGTINGTPAACNALEATEAGYTCHEADARVSIVVGSGATLGWSVTGEMVARAYFRARFDGGECETTPIEPQPTGAAGTFVKTRGVINVLAQFRAEGTGSVKFLGGTIFSVSRTAACDNTMKIWAHATDTTNACVKPKCRTDPQSSQSLLATDVDCEIDEPAPPTEEPPTEPTVDAPVPVDQEVPPS